MVGRTLGHYRVLRAIGAGGMGVTFLAQDERLQRNVVLKVLPPATTDDQSARDRLLREARLASALNHPYICTVYEVGEADGIVFIAMEHVEGRCLNALPAPIRPRDALRYASQIAEALEHAHARGIVHRDLKSANVMVTPEGRVKVLDFGLAVRLRSDDTCDVTRSQSFIDERQAAGTLAYMAPEVLRGMPADQRADVWALGIMLFEMVVGHKPFQGNSAYELTSAILRDDVPGLRASLPGGVSLVIGRCLAKEPNQRYQTASEVHAALEGIQSGIVQSVRARSLKWPGRLSFIAAFALLAVLGSLYWFFARPNPTRSLAVLPFSISRAESEFLSDGLTDSLIDNMSRVPGLRIISHTSAFRYKNKQIDPRIIGHELRVNALLNGGVTLSGDNVSVTVELVSTADDSRLWGQRYQGHLSDLERIPGEIAEQVRVELRQHLSDNQQKRFAKHFTGSSEAYQLYLRGRYYWYKGTPDAYETALRFYQQAIDADPAYAMPYAGIAAYYMQVADDGLAPPNVTFPRAKAASEQALALDRDLGLGHSGLASVALLYDWNLPEAERHFKIALELMPNWAETYREYAICMRALGRLDEAVAAAKRARELDPLSVSINTSLGWTYYYAHRYADAIDQFRNSILMDRSSLSAQLGLAYAYQQNGMEREAIEALQSYATASNAANLASVLGDTYGRSGFRSAVNSFWMALLNANAEAAKRGYISPWIFAGLHARLGNKDETFVWLERAFRERSSKLLDLKLDPDFESLRDDPRYVDLVHRVGLP